MTVGPVHAGSRLRRTVALALAAWLAAPAGQAAAVHKCVVDGVVSYQADPCPATGPRRTPSVEQLNAERRKKLAAEAAAREAAPPRSLDGARTGAPRTAPAAAPFRCDGRRYCSQMHSCEEAMYFLAHCPGVKMDGNHDGVPCERQWCGK